jgi:subtilisin family serine protease
MPQSVQIHRKKRQLRPVARRALVFIAVTTCLLLGSTPARADTRIIVRIGGGLPLIQTICNLLGCNVQYGLGDPQGQLFLLTAPDILPLNLFLNIPGILGVELDRVGRTTDGPSQGAVPSALYDATPIDYFGTTVRNGYVNQPATRIVRLQPAQTAFAVAGQGTVAVIDTGVDPTHPVLAHVLLPGYDFTRNRMDADETGDVMQSTTAVVDGAGPAVVSQSTTAVVDGNTGTVLNQPQYAAFGHGTMVAGIVHLVAPAAMILPLKAFHADGTGYTSDIIRAIYFAVRSHARVLNMSFSFASCSPELKTALTFANLQGTISVAAAGNDGRQTLVYPAAYQSMVMGVASTSNDDALSSFSNYGQNLVWVAAPGEGVVTLYPFGTYAATWGTSFSTPFVSGAAALLLGVQPNAGEYSAAQAIGQAQAIGSAVGKGRLDVYRAIQSVE